MPKISQELIQSAFYLYTDRASAEEGGDAKGTGFVVAHHTQRDGGQSFAHYYAVTNRHVARIAPVVRLNSDKIGPIFPFDESEWDYHPDGDDIAIIPLHLQSDAEWPDIAAVDTGRFIGKENRSSDGIGVGDDVFMIGLFVDHEGKGTNNPLARFGNISMMASEDSKISQHGRKMLSHIIDMHSRTGFSGSPVFVYRTFGADLSRRLDEEIVRASLANPKQFKNVSKPGDFPTEIPVKLRTHSFISLLGIHWGQFPERWEIREKEPTRTEAEAASMVTDKRYVNGYSGMTCVAPAWKIKELIEMPKQEEKRLEAERLMGRRGPSGPALESVGGDGDEANPRHAEDFNSLLDAAVRGKPSID